MCIVWILQEFAKHREFARISSEDLVYQRPLVDLNGLIVSWFPLNFLFSWLLMTIRASWRTKVALEGTMSGGEHRTVNLKK